MVTFLVLDFWQIGSSFFCFGVERKRKRHVVLVIEFSLSSLLRLKKSDLEVENMKRKRGEEEEEEKKMEIVWQTPANPPERHDYIFRNGNFKNKKDKIMRVYTYVIYIYLYIEIKDLNLQNEIFLAGIVQGDAMSDRITSSSSLMYVS